ncbi:MAG: murein biosynthesis integral membrane protein MurJ [Alphaproteobacteria bacterium 41-28]|nr:MAG: murein biosynthesis integral membrane protein MurJ [Alphaproteobacteria bacterium 41-28]
MHLYRSIATVGGFTFLSRVTGFIRDALIAGILGVSGLTDAFFVAFKLPNFFRRFFAEGAFNAAFVPLFSGMLVSSGPNAARLYGEKIFALLLVGLTGFVFLFENFMPWAVFLFAPGFEATPERFDLAVALSRITFPYILFISLASLLSGILNSMGKFAAPAGTPIILNLTMIVALMMALFEWISPGKGLAWAVFLAGILQLVWLWVSCHFHGMSIRLSLPELTPDAKSLIRLGIPGAISAGVIQVNLFMDMIFASWLPTGAISYLFYADRLNQLPLGVIGIAVSTALLPELSKHVKAGNHQEAHFTQNRALEFALAITLPATVGLIVLGSPLVALLFERGAFTSLDAQSTGYTLSAFAVGLPAYVLVKILSTQFFAHQDTKTPMKVAIAAVALNFILNCLFIGPFSYVGLALATALSAWFNALTLGTFLFLREWIMFDARMKAVLPRLMASSFIMGLLCYGFQVITPFPKALLMRIGIVGLWIVGGTLAYVMTARLVGTFYFKDLQKFLKTQSLS